jgi:uncharacterized protein (TIGR01244 family)
VAVPYRRLAEDFAACGQISPEDLPEIAAQGFRLVINNRPDGEGGPGQPGSAQIEAAAKAAGLAYLYLPVVPGQMTPEQVSAMAEALRGAAGPVFAFCRTGTRTEFLFRMAAQAG